MATITVASGIQRDQTKKIAVEFRNASNALADPTTVTFSFRNPTTGITTTYTYPTDTQLVKDSTGMYHVNLTLSATGTWHTRWKGAGVVDQAAYADLIVNPDSVP